MSGRVVKFEGTMHTEADRLLPWYVNGTLEGEEYAMVTRHLAECAQCQQEVDWLRTLQAEYTFDASRHADAEATRAIKRLRRRMRSHAAAISPTAPRRGWGRRERWLTAAIAIQAVLVIALVGVFWRDHQGTAEYRTLSSPQARGALLVVTFDPGITEGRMRELVRGNDLRIVGGPTEAGAYLLSVAPERADSVRDSLRHAAGVTLAERMDGTGDR